MNNNIQEDYCSFEVSKLLKEKGFNLTETLKYSFHPPSYKEQRKDDNEEYTICPTHSLAIKWIRENFGIEIYFRPERNARTGITTYYYGISKICSTNHFEIVEVVDLMNSNYPTYGEATEAALLYTLKNLI